MIREHETVALPGLPVDYPIEVQGGLDSVTYSWVARGDSVPTGQPRPLVDGLVHRPLHAGRRRQCRDQGLRSALLVARRQETARQS